MKTVIRFALLFVLAVAACKTQAAKSKTVKGERPEMSNRVQEADGVAKQVEGDCRSDLTYELRVIDVDDDGGTDWTYTDKDPGVGMDAFSTVSYKGARLMRGRSPLASGRGWRDGRHDYWVRKEFGLPVSRNEIVGGSILVNGKNTVEIWMNGKEVYSASQNSWHYHKIELLPEYVEDGKNVIAIHVQIPQNQQSGVLDVGLYLQGEGIHKAAERSVGKTAPFVPVDINSLNEDDAVVKNGVHGGAEWRYSIMRPSAKWMAKDYDDSKWKKGRGGFGGGSALGLRQYGLELVRRDTHTEWTGNDIWLRTDFNYDGNPSDLRVAVLSFRCGGQVTIYLNGKKIIEGVGLKKNVCASHQECDMWNVFDMTEKIRSVISKGRNVLALSTHQEDGRSLTYWQRNVDAGLYIRSSKAK